MADIQVQTPKVSESTPSASREPVARYIEWDDIAKHMIKSVEVSIGSQIVQYTCQNCGYQENAFFGSLPHHDKCPCCDK